MPNKPHMLTSIPFTDSSKVAAQEYFRKAKTHSDKENRTEDDSNRKLKPENTDG